MGILTGNLDIKVYRIEAFNDSSFEKILKELINYILSDYEVKKISYKDSLSPDSVKVGERSFTPNFQKPKYIYASFNMCSKNGWTNRGGHRFCECILKNEDKILVNWAIGSDGRVIEELDIKFLRKMKLKQIENKLTNL